MIAKNSSSKSIDSVHSARYTLTTSTSTSNSTSTSSSSTTVEDLGPDDDQSSTMSAEDQTSRSLTVFIPKLPGAEGPYCPRRPTLREILANTAPLPWTLAAFMAYLSNNHCLETLEFTMDAGRYAKHYERMMAKAAEPGVLAPKDAEYVKQLWNRLTEAYIRPNGSREVNLPSEVRDPIITLKPSSAPPNPEVLAPAVAKTYELMEESVLVPFLNSIYPHSTNSTPLNSYSTSRYTASHENLSTQSYEDKPRFSRRGRHHPSRSSPPPQTPLDRRPFSPPSLPNRKSAPSALTTALTKSRFSTKISPTSSAPCTQSSTLTTPCSDAVFSGAALTDDSGSSGSPVNDSPMTPPITPPTCDMSISPRQSRDSGTWKKFGRLSGWKPGRKKSQGFRDQELQ